MFITDSITTPGMKRHVVKPIRLITGFLFILLTTTACDAVRQPDPSPTQGTGDIPDWPRAVQEAIAKSPDYELGPFEAMQQRQLSTIADEVSRFDARAENVTEAGNTLLKAGRNLVTSALSEYEPVVVYSLTGSVQCQLASSFTGLTSAVTMLAEAYAKQHAFNNGNEYSWPGFIQAVWADTATDRADWAVENGSTAADAQEAIDELNNMTWHANQAIGFEQQSFAITNDGWAQSVISLLESAKDLADGTRNLLTQCKATL